MDVERIGLAEAIGRVRAEPELVLAILDQAVQHDDLETIDRLLGELTRAAVAAGGQAAAGLDLLLDKRMGTLQHLAKAHPNGPLPARLRAALLAQQAVGEGVEHSLFYELIEHPPSAERFTELVTGLVPKASPLGRFGIAELALNLVDRGPEYRQAAEIAIEGASFGDSYVNTLALRAKQLQGADLLWWHDLFCRELRDDHHYRALLYAHGPFLLQERHAAVLEYLLVPDRGPASNNVYAFSEVIELLDGCPPLERRWSEWIRTGRFERRQPGDEHPSILGLRLANGLTRQPPVYKPLLADALERWRSLLASDNGLERHRGLEAMVQLATDAVTFDGRLLAEVVDYLHPDEVPALAAATREAILTAWRVEQVEKRKPDYPRSGAAMIEPSIHQFRSLVQEFGTSR